MTRTFPIIVVAILASASVGRANDAPVRLDVPLFEGGDGLDIYYEIARAYEAARPDVRVDAYGDPRIADKIRIRVLEKNFPELTNASFGAWNLIRAKAILPLDEVLDGPNWEGDGTWRASFLPGTLDTFTHEGSVYAVPLGYYVQGIYYNKKMFRAHGWEPPATWDEFLALCETIKAAGVPPLAFQGRYVDYAYPLVDSAYYQLAGKRRYDALKDLVPGTLDTPEMVQALAWTQRLATDYFQPGAMGMGHTESQLQFFLGHTAMIPCGAWLKSEMTGKIPDGFELGTFNLPSVPGGKGDPTALMASGGYFCVFAGARHPREAADFLRFMTSRTMAARYCAERDLPVAVKGVNEANLSSDLSDLVGMIRDARTTYGQAPGDAQSLMSQEYADVYAALLAGRVTPADAARDLEERAARVRQLVTDPDAAPVRHVAKPMVLIGLLAAGLAYWVVTTIRRLRLPGGPVTDAGRPLRWRYVLAFVGPALLLFLAFVVLPAATSFAWSVQQWDGLTEMRFAGARHFRHLLFVGDGFWVALRNNLFIMFVIPAFLIPLALLLAACISRGVRGATVFRAAFLIPSVMGGVAATLLWMHLYDPQAGIVNGALVAVGRGLAWLGLDPIADWFLRFRGFAWLSQDNLYTALIPMSVWTGFGFNLVLYLAAMEAIPGELYEAAELDGATPWQQFRTITLPLIWEVLTISTVFLIIGGMKAFEVIWLLTNQRPSTQAHVIGTRMVQAMFTEMNVGQATALAVLLFVMVFAASAVALRVMRRDAVEM